MSQTEVSSQSGGGFKRIIESEWMAYVVLAAAFLPLTIPNWWPGKWRISLFQLMLWLDIFGKRKLAIWVLFPFYLIMPVLVFVCRYYGPPNVDLLESVASSTFGERRAFWSTIPTGYFWLYLLMIVPICAAKYFSGPRGKCTPARVRL